MGTEVIKIENLGKQYRLGQIGTGTLSHDLNRWWARVRGKQDPFSKIGTSNDRQLKSQTDYVWALRNVSFCLEQGDVLGVIGRNGAGKSTLLKLLSQITSPSEGSIYYKGKMASLLEVGTGFHPELTGRENVYLNGAILGMSKQDIRRQFDNIVEFSGCAAYVDTPVKRYSSGMVVRLGFSVAAHLDTDILIVDEVLAVGDLEFQQKCLGKMSEVSKSGRTVLFVSHNMQAVGKLCTKGLYLKNGCLESTGEIDLVIQNYIKSVGSSSFSYSRSLETLSSLKVSFISSVHIVNESNQPTGEYCFGDIWKVVVKLNLKKDLKHVILALSVLGAFDEVIHTSWSLPRDLNAGEYEYTFTNDLLLFTAGVYSLSLGLSTYERGLDYLPSIITFTIIDTFKKTIDPRIARVRGNGFVANQLNEKIIKI